MRTKSQRSESGSAGRTKKDDEHKERKRRQS
jgi:hypothetical protein